MIGPLKLFDPLTNDTPLHGANAAYLEDLYSRYRSDPDSLDAEWRRYFAHLDQRRTADGDGSAVASIASAGLSESNAHKEATVLRTINAYRVRGHQIADIDPLRFSKREEVPDLDPVFQGLNDADMKQEFETPLAESAPMPLADILKQVRAVYCGTIGSEFMHITSLEERRWIQARLEPTQGKWHAELKPEARRDILEQLTAAEGIEKYLHTKYVGQKRFSLEGGDSLIPMLDEIIQRGGGNGISEFVIGMAHRGRLNVLVNILGKSPEDLFSEFEGKYATEAMRGAGDVKYHQGYSSDIQTPGGPVHVALAFNPSHLEIVVPVAEGSVKARQLRRGDRSGTTVLPIAIHGDAAFAGQGVVMETFNLSSTRGYGTGGTVHIIVNNQIGFTTSNPLDARSTLHCTEVAKLVEAPIFHVNGDDPDAVVFVTRLALDYRMQFQKDVVIDLVCYRRQGHNEADEPRVTQPMMYKIISALPTTMQIYAKRLIEDQVINADDAKRMVSEYRDSLDKGHVVVREFLHDIENKYAFNWKPYVEAKRSEQVKTGVSMDVLRELADRLQTIPEGFELHPRVSKIMQDRRRMVAGELPLDWGMAETLAYATLIRDGTPVRLSGQDSGRGTFFHRHATLHDQNSREVYVPLRNLFEGQPRYLVINSLLSEEAVLAFEYGYSTAEPTTLVIWEAQFGDFANGAQVVIDQFISSGETKWGRLCGLTLLLPHGYEGQGPEHSSARLERYLQLCADFNQQVCIPTVPAQFYHLLRRQGLRKYKRPLIVLTPKSLLRHKFSTSALSELEQGSFQEVIPEQEKIRDSAVTRMVVCSGKVYFDLLDARQKHSASHVALLRVEQLYPFPRTELKQQVGRYKKLKEVVWCQEEPRNQGAWYQIQHHLKACAGDQPRLLYSGRPPSPSSAAGYMSKHLEQQTKLVEDAIKSKFAKN